MFEKRDNHFPMLVSIIIPAYNVGDYIRATVESAISQTYSKIEVIIVDDGSVDHTASICAQFAARDSRIQFYQQPNRGVVAARFNGFEHARGDVILFLDGDDLLTLNAVEEVVNVFNQEGVELLRYGYSPFVTTVGDSADVVPSKTGAYNLLELLGDDALNIKSYAASSIWDKAYSSALVRKVFDVINEVRINHSEDMLFSLVALCEARRIYFLQRPLYLYRQRSGSAINSFNKSLMTSKVQYLQSLRQYTGQRDQLSLNWDSFFASEYNQAISAVTLNTLRYCKNSHDAAEVFQSLRNSFIFVERYGACVSTVTRRFRNALLNSKCGSLSLYLFFRVFRAVI